MQILLVEDHVDSANGLARILGRQGHRVVIAPSLAAAREAAASQAFSLMICDLGLPDGDGADLMREFSKKYSFPGIALTGFGMPDELSKGHEAGFSAIVIKPVVFDKLDAILVDVMREKHSSQAGVAPPAQPTL